MKYTKDFEELGLPQDFKFGIELEENNVKTKGENAEERKIYRERWESVKDAEVFKKMKEKDLL